MDTWVVASIIVFYLTRFSTRICDVLPSVRHYILAALVIFSKPNTPIRFTPIALEHTEKGKSMDCIF